MKKRALKKILLSLVIAVVCMTMFMGSSCSYLIYSIYMKGYEQQVIEEEIKRREEKENQGNNGGEAIAREVYYNPVSAGEVAGYHMFTLVDSTTYTIDAYEYTTPAGGSAYSSRIFHMQGNYTREGNLVTVKAGISMYAYTTGSSSSQEFFPGESETERKAIYESFVGGEKYTIALKADGTFEAGGTADGEEAVTGVSGAKVYRWYDDSSRITIKTLTVFEDNSYVITAFSTHSTNHEQPVSSFIANGTLSYSESESTEEYKIVDIQDGTGMCYVSNNGSPMWNDCIKDALGANWWDLSISNRSFYVTDDGFTYVNGMIKEEIPAGGLYGYVRDSGTEEPEEPETPEVLVTLQGDANSAIQLTLYKDGTADFTFTTYNSTTSGTWTFENGEFTFSGTANKQDGSTVDFENKSQVKADGTLIISIDTKNGMTQNYTLTAAQVGELFGGNSVFLEGNSANGSLITLTLYENNTFVFHFGAHGMDNNESGTWSYENGELVLTTTAGYEAVNTTVSGDSVTFTYSAFNGQANQEYTITAEQLASLQNAPEVLMALEGDANSAIQLILYKDGTADFTFTTYNATTSGVWSYKNGEFTFSGTANSQSGSVAFENKSQVEADGTLIIKIDTKNGMTQNYTLTAYQAALLNNNHEVLMALEGDANSAIQLILYKDGTADFTFTTYNATTSGVWSYKNGEFTFSGTANSQSGPVEFENKSQVAADGTLIIKIDTKNGMTQNYTLTAYQAALLNNNHEVLMALEGDANSAIQLILYKDGTADFTFTTYNATTSGTWTFENGEFTFSGTANSQSGPVAFENKSQVEADGTIVIAIDTKNGMTQNYTLTAYQAALLNNNHEVLMALEGDANSAIQLILYKDGTADFTFTTYNATTSGVWSYKNGEFTFSGTANSQSGPVAFENKSQVEDGTLIIKIDTKNGMTQNYTLTAEQVASLG